MYAIRSYYVDRKARSEGENAASRNDDEAYDEPEDFFEERVEYEPEKDLYVSDEIPS